MTKITRNLWMIISATVTVEATEKESFRWAEDSPTSSVTPVNFSKKKTV